MIHHIHKYSKSILPALFCLFFTAKIFAQQPVQIVPQLVAPYSLSLSDYYSGTTPKLYLTITNRDLQQPSINVKLRVTITGTSVVLKSKPTSYYPTITLDAGIPQRLSQGDLEPYFNPANLDFQGITQAEYVKQKKLPEGMYNFCFEAIEANTNQVLSKSECAMAWISLSDPPILNSPFRGVGIATQDPTNIIFNWTPRHLNSPNGAFNTEYEFQMVEIFNNNIDPNAAFQNSPIFYSTTTTATTLLYGATQPLLMIGKKYAWRVKVKANTNDDKDEFKNGGYSDVSWFNFNDKCEAPADVKATANADKSFTLSWTAAPNITEYDIEYNETSNPKSDWIYKTVNNVTQFKINNAQLGSKYSYTIISKCGAGTGGISGGMKFFDMSKGLAAAGLPNTVPVKGKILWAYYDNADEPSTDNKPLLSTATTYNRNQRSKYEPSENTTKRLPLKNVEVFFYVNDKTETCIATAKTNENGEYILNIDPTLIENDAYVYMTVKPTNWIFNKTFVEVARRGNSSKINLTELPTHTLFAKTLNVTPTVYAPSITTATANSLSVDMLLEESKFDRTYGSMAKEFGITERKIVNYNNEKYVVVKSFKNGDNYKKLLEANYVAKINYANDISLYESGFLDRGIINQRCFKYDINTYLNGVVKFYAKPVAQAQVYATVNAKDVLSNTSKFYVDSKGEISLSTTTDNNGAYSFNTLPMLKPNARVLVTVMDRTISPLPFVDSVSTVENKSTLTKDVILENKVYTFFGRLLDQYNKPVVNALITINGTSATARSSSDGYYMIKSNYAWDKSVTVTADNYNEVTMPLSSFGVSDFVTKKLQPSAANWKALIESACKTQGYDLQNITANSLAIGNGSLEDIYPNYFDKNKETLAGVRSHSLTRLQNNNITINFNILLKGKKVKSRISIIHIRDNGATKYADQFSEENKTFAFKGIEGLYNVSIFPATTEKFVPIYRAQIILNQIKAINGVQDVTFDLVPCIALNGIVKSREKNEAIEGAEISLEGLPSSRNTNASGQYELTLRENTYYKLKISKTGYISLDTTVTTTNLNAAFNVSLKKADIKITTLSGYAVKIDKQEGIGENSFRISGKLVLTQNQVFSTTEENKELTFKNITVQTKENSGNAVPLGDVSFEEPILQTTAFGYVPVEINGVKLSKLSNATTYERGVIGGSSLKARLSTVGQASTIPIKLTDAEMTNATTDQTNNPFKYVYIAYDSNIAAFSQDSKFSLNYENTSSSSSNTKYIEANLMPLVSLYVEKEKASIDKEGVNMNGYFQIPTSISPNASNGGRIEIQKFAIKKDLRSYDLSFNIGENHPIIMPLYKIRAQLTGLMLTGLGSKNFGAGFAGKIWLKKEDSLPANKRSVLTINELSLTRSNNETTLKGDFALPEEGISIKSLVFKAPKIAMSFNFSTKDFELDATGSISSNSTSQDGIFKTVFKAPIEIQRFILTTKKFGLFLVAKSDIKLDFKVMSVNVTKLLINVGIGMDMDRMNQYLLADSAGVVKLNNEPTQVVNENEPVSETQTNCNWAIGIAGGIEFPNVKGMSVAASASLLVGNINGKIDARLNEIALKIDNSPTFLLDARVKISYSGRRTGFEAAAKLEMLGNIIDGGFKYYNIADSANSKGGIEIGARLAYTSTVPLTVVPPFPLFDIHGLGGGFNFNTSTNVYEVFVSGKFTTPGTPMATAYLDVARIGLIFSTNDCGAYPVIEGEASLYIRNQRWATIQAKADFCKQFLFVTIDGQVPIMPEIMPTIGVQGVLYADGKKQSIFLGVNAFIHTDILYGNATIALGYNYKYVANDSKILDNLNASQGRTTPLVDIKTFWDKISNEAKDVDGTFNGIFLSAAAYIAKQSGQDCMFRTACYYYDIGANLDGIFYYKFKENSLGFKGNAHAWIFAKVSIFDWTAVEAKAEFKVKLEGGYKNWGSNGYYNKFFEGWHFLGDGEGYVQVQIGSGAGCNDYCFFSCQGAKICVHRKIRLFYEQGSAVSLIVWTP